MRRLIIVLLLFCCIDAVAQESSFFLTVQPKAGGTPQLFYADEIDYIDFSASSLIVHPKKGGEQAFAKSDMQWVSFSEDTHEAVDLGLSVKWASCNVGGNAPQDYGNYYSWGETSTKSDYSENRYSYYSKGQYQYIGTNICGTRYDVARQLWGGNWRLPTRAEVKELATLCTWKAEELEGVAGYRVTAPNGRSIFLPSAGYQSEKTNQEQGTGGFYWTGTLDTAMPSAAYNINFRGYDAEWSASRAYGFSVRPVR
jgi:hypothetical protein